MIQQITLQEPESNSLDGNSEEILSLLSDRIFSLGTIEHPIRLFREIKAYIKRNTIILGLRRKVKNNSYICKACLKAHIEFLAKKEHLETNIAKFLSSTLNCKTGHNRYYLDGELLRKV